MPVPQESSRETLQVIFQQAFQEKMTAYIEAGKEAFPAGVVDIQITGAALSAVEELAEQLHIPLTWPAKQEEAQTSPPPVEPTPNG